MNYLIQVINDIWMMMTAAAPYILLGFLAAGVLHTFVKADRIVSLLGKRSWKSVTLASLCGVPLPLCSCSVLPTAAALRKKGASRGATTSFLISTPETGVDSIALTYGMMGGWMAVLRPVAAGITALSAGLAVNYFGGNEPEKMQDDEETTPSCCHKEEPKQKSCCHTEEQDESLQPKPQSWWYKTLHYGFVQLSDDLAKWLALGFILSGLIAALIPASVFDSWVGQGFSSLVLMLIISMPMYICASGSTPVAAAMLMKGLSPGAAVVLLLAGPATNMASLPLLYKMLGKRSTFIYLGCIFTMTLAIGVLINVFFTADQFVINLGHEHGESAASIFKTTCAVILAGLILKGLWYGDPMIPKAKPTAEHQHA